MSDSRLGSIAGILGPKAPTPPTPRIVEAAHAPVEEPREPATKAPGERPRVRRQSATSATRPRVVTRLPQELHDQLVKVAATERLSYAAVLLRAVEKAYEDDVLEDLIAGQRAEDGGEGGLFSHHAPRPRPSAKVPTEFQPHHADLKKLDDLWKQLGARDRTEFLTVALAHYFAAA